MREFGKPWTVDLPDGKVGTPEWVRWVSGLGLDPSVVPVGSRMILDPNRRSVALHVYVLGSDGQIVSDGLAPVKRWIEKEVLWPPSPPPRM